MPKRQYNILLMSFPQHQAVYFDVTVLSKFVTYRAPPYQLLIRFNLEEMFFWCSNNVGHVSFIRIYVTKSLSVFEKFENTLSFTNRERC